MFHGNYLIKEKEREKEKVVPTKNETAKKPRRAAADINTYSINSSRALKVAQVINQRYHAR